MEDETDDEMFRDDLADDCDCEQADIDILEWRGHCHVCGRIWYLTKEEIEAETRFQAEYAQAVEDEASKIVDGALTDQESGG